MTNLNLVLAALVVNNRNYSYSILRIFKNYLPLFILFLVLNNGHSQEVIQIQKRTSILELECIETLNVILDENCSFIMTPAMLITGNIDTIDSYVVTIDGQTTDLIVGCGDHSYSIELIENDEVVFTCAGNVLAEDETPPNVVCPDDRNSVTLEKQVQVFTGALEDTDDQIELVNFNCLSENAASGPHFYDFYTFNVTTTGFYTFMGQLMDVDFDATISLFEGYTIEPNDPCSKILIQKEMLHSSPVGEEVPIDNRLSIFLDIDKQYTLMVSSRSEANAIGNYTVFTYAENDGVINSSSFMTNNVSIPLTTPLVCMDLSNVSLDQPQHYIVDSQGAVISGSMSEELRQILEYTGYPSIHDNCGMVDVWVTDLITEAGDCGAWTIARTFSIADRADESCTGTPRTDECTQLITVRKPRASDVFLPPVRSYIACDENYLTDGAEGGEDDNPHASETAYPFIMTSFGYHELVQGQCVIGASYSDEPRINICESVYKFRREWNIIDWCSPGSFITFDQIIKIGDDVGPTVYVNVPDYNNDGSPNSKFRYSTSPFGCNAEFPIPTAIVEDTTGCSGMGTRRVDVYTVEGNFVWAGQEGTEISLPIGDYTFRWCVEDACGNETCVSIGACIRDEIEPSVECDQEVNVSIGNGDVLNGLEGGDRLFATNIDDGSTDNCGDVTLTVRRNYWQDNTCDEGVDQWSLWDEYVDFYCCDIDREITIELRATDQSGNWSVCSRSVTPVDDLVPSCSAPQSVTLFSTDLPLEFPSDIEQAYEDDFEGTSAMMNDLFGFALGTDNCAVDSIVELSPLMNINDCGWGLIERRFEVWQWQPAGDVNNNGIFESNEAWISTNTCAQLITIVESCEQISAPALAIGEYGGATELCPSLEAGQFGDPDGYCEATIHIPFEIIGDCSSGQAEGDSSIYIVTAELDLFVVDANNDGIISANEFTVEEGAMGDVSMNIQNNLDGTYTAIGAYPIIPSTMGDSVYHAINILVEDGCGNQTNEIIHFDVIDCAKPEINCVSEMNVTLLPVHYNRCELIVEADDFLTSLSYDCTGQGPDVNSSGALAITQYAIYRDHQVANPLIFQPDPTQTSLRLSENGQKNVFIYAFDGEGNTNFCEVVLSVNSDDNCSINDQEQTHGIVAQSNDGNTVIADRGTPEKKVSAVELYQNTPNPFANETAISFSIPTDMEIVITLTDSRGRMIYKSQADYFVAGFNEVKIAKKMLHGTTGVINYTITSDEYTSTKRMIVLE